MTTMTTRSALAATLLLVCAVTGCGASGGDAPEPIVYSERPAPADPAPTPAPTNAGGLVVSADPCQSDADCVPAGCCHAAACVARANAPSCGDAMCTEECRFGTLDCGGACLCHEGRCAARLSEPPAMVPEQGPSGS
jgi:hypothetical protein